MLSKPMGPQLIFDTEFYDKAIYDQVIQQNEKITKQKQRIPILDLTFEQVESFLYVEQLLSPFGYKYLRPGKQTNCQIYVNIKKAALCKYLATGTAFALFMKEFDEKLRIKHIYLNPKNKTEIKINFQQGLEVLSQFINTTKQFNVDYLISGDINSLLDLFQQSFQTCKSRKPLQLINIKQLLAQFENSDPDEPEPNYLDLQNTENRQIKPHTNNIEIQNQQQFQSQVESEINATIDNKTTITPPPTVPAWVIQEINKIQILNKLKFINDNNHLFLKAQFYNGFYTNSHNPLENSAQNESAGHQIPYKTPTNLNNCRQNIAEIYKFLLNKNVNSSQLPEETLVLKHDLFAVTLLLKIVLGISNNFDELQPKNYVKIVNFIQTLDVKLSKIEDIITFSQNGIIFREFLKRIFQFQQIDVQIPPNSIINRTLSQRINCLGRLKEVAANQKILILKNLSEVADGQLSSVRKELLGCIEIYEKVGGIIVEFQNLKWNYFYYQNKYYNNPVFIIQEVVSQGQLVNIQQLDLINDLQ